MTDSPSLRAEVEARIGFAEIGDDHELAAFLVRVLAALPPDCGRGGALDWLLDALEQNEKGLSSNTQAAINAVRAAIPPAPGAAPQEPTQKRAFEDVPSLHGVVLDHFAKFADEPRPTMPEGYAAPLDARPVRQLIAEREAGAAPAPSARDVETEAYQLATVVAVHETGNLLANPNPKSVEAIRRALTSKGDGR